VLTIRKAGHPDLKVMCPAFDFAHPATPPGALAADLIHAMKRHNGLGLAAPQIGIHTRVFALLMSGDGVACFNPSVLDEQGSVLGSEGCLSYPGVYYPILRARTIRAAWTSVSGARVVVTLKDMTARAFLHELDHLNGLTIDDRVTPVGKALAAKQNAQRRAGGFGR
jgi:peptide deformylase